MPIQPSDLPRRALALERAAALAERLGGVWPFAPEPVEFKPYLNNRSNAECAWHRDENGVATRGGNHGVPRRRYRDTAAIVDDEDDEDF